MTTQDLRALGVIPCDRCRGTGHTRVGDSVAFCDCATGRALWDAALARAFEATA